MGIDYQPPVETGLSGERYLSEAIETHADGPSDAHAPGVYVLRCSRPDPPTEERHREAWRAEFDAVPETIIDMAYAETLAYVGAAKDVYDRLEDHVNGDHRQSAFLRVFPPHEIHTVWWFDTADEAFTRESWVAQLLRANYPSWFVWQA